MKKIIAILVLIIIASLFLAGCKQAEEQPTAAEPAMEQTTENETPPSLPDQTTTEDNILSGLMCVDDNIQGTITNVLNQQISIEDIRVLFNGNVVDTDALRCDKTTLSPGESTLCESLQGVVPVTGTNTIDVVIGDKTDNEAITC